MLIAQLPQLVSIAAAEAAENEQFDPDKVTPGVGGFLVVAAVAIALFFLGLDLVRRLRRAKYRDEIQRELAAELAERDASALGAAQAPAGGTGEAGEDRPVPESETDGGEADPRPASDEPRP